MDTGSNTYHIYALLLGAEDSDGCDNAEYKDDKIWPHWSPSVCVVFFESWTLPKYGKSFGLFTKENVYIHTHYFTYNFQGLMDLLKFI